MVRKVTPVSRASAPMRVHAQRGGRHFPSVISNNYVSFWDPIQDLYRHLPDQFSVILDTGNSTQTTIGRNVARYLNLDVRDISPIMCMGVGGLSVCRETVTLGVQFAYPYNRVQDDPNVKDLATLQPFEALLSNEDGMNDKIIFGQEDALSQIFNAGFHIDANYHSNHPKYLQSLIREQTFKNEPQKALELLQFLRNFELYIKFDRTDLPISKIQEQLSQPLTLGFPMIATLLDYFEEGKRLPRRTQLTREALILLSERAIDVLTTIVTNEQLIMIVQKLYGKKVIDALFDYFEQIQNV
jgi:hypothetical protein